MLQFFLIDNADTTIFYINQFFTAKITKCTDE